MICLFPPAKQTKIPVVKLQFLDVIIPHPQPLTAPLGYNDSLIDLEHLAIITDISHLKFINEKYLKQFHPQLKSTQSL
jgi:hypothetical protein